MRRWVVLKNKLATKFSFKSKLWKSEGPAGWCFVTIPISSSKEIRDLYKNSEEGWGRLKTTVSIGSSNWKTSVWFDTKFESYLLPVRTSVRKKERLIIGTFVVVTLEFEIDQWLFKRL